MTDVAQKQGGRPTAYTPKLGRAICVRVSKVGFEAVAAELLGIHRNTLRNWRERGERGEEPFAAFAVELAAAKAQYVRSELEKVKDPTWKLERIDREQFSAPHKVEHTGKDGKPIAVKHVHAMTDEELERIARGG